MSQKHFVDFNQRDVVRFVRACKKLGFNDARVMIAVSSGSDELAYATASALVSLRSIARDGRLPWTPEVYRTELIRVFNCSREKLQSFPPMA